MAIEVVVYRDGGACAARSEIVCTIIFHKSVFLYIILQMDTVRKINDFIKNDFANLSIPQRGLLTVSFRNIIVRYSQLSLLHERCIASSNVYWEKFVITRDISRSHREGNFTLTKQEDEEYEAMYDANRQAILDLEQFYQKSTDLLNATVNATYIYFGPAARRFKSLKSLGKTLAAYSAEKCLIPPTEKLIHLISVLDKDIIRFRGDYLSHQDDKPYYQHVMSSAGFGSDMGGEAFLCFALLYPRGDSDEKDLPRGRKPSDLIQQIDTFYEEWLSYISENKKEKIIYTDSEIRDAIWRT
jgi:hypothetical protein